MRLLCLAFTVAAAAIGQPVISNVQVTTSHASVMVRADIANTTGQSLLQLHYGTTSALGFATTNAPSSAATPTRTMVEAGLTPSSTYFFRIKVTANSGTTLWSCTPGSSGPGWTCDGSGAGLFTTTALPANHGESPELPAEVDSAMPAVNGQSFAVGASCANLQAMLNACAAADQTLIHQVTIPSSAVCRGTFDLPAKTGPGVCIVRSAVPDNELPPEGVRIDPSYAAKTPRLILPQSATGALASPRGILNASATQGWRLVGLTFELDSPLAHRKIPISSISAAGIVTTSVPHGLEFWQQIYISGAQGFRGRGPNGVWGAQVTGPSTFRLASGASSAMGTPNFTCAQAPCHIPGTGFVVQNAGLAIESATASTPPVVTTTHEHGLFNEPWVNILSASGSSLTVEAGHSIDAFKRPIEIAESSVAAYNGVWVTSGASGVNVPLVLGPAVSCSANCGRVRVKRPLHIQGADTPGLNGNHLFTVVDDFRVQLDDAAGGAYTGGGVLSFDPDYYYAMLRFMSPSARIVVDRCIVKGAEWPNRLLFAIVLQSNDSAVVDSWIHNVKNWRAVNPKSNLYEYAHDDFFSATSTALEITIGDRKKIHNNYINAVGISLFSQEAHNGTVLQDVTITRNVFYSSAADMAGSETSNGLYYPKRHHFEVKQAKRVRIEGNILDGNWSDWTPCGPALILSPRAASHTVNQIADITIRSNTIRNASSGIQVVGTDSMSQGSVGYLTQRVKIDGNLIYDIDLRKWSSVPTAVGGPGICGFAVQALWPVEDLSINGNTAIDMRGKQPQFFSYGYGRSEAVVVRRNLFTHNYDNNAGALTPAGQLTGLLPAITGTIRESWDQYFRSASDFRGNVVIPGVRSTVAGASYDLLTTQNYKKSECDLYYTGFSNITCVGSGAVSETATQRLAAVGFFDLNNRQFRLRPDSVFQGGSQADGVGSGVDFNVLESAQGKVRNLRIQPGSASTLFSYVAPDSQACFVDYGTNPQWTGHTRLSDGGGAILRTVTLTGLNPGTLYYYRLQCASEQPKGSFVTQR